MRAPHLPPLKCKHGDIHDMAECRAQRQSHVATICRDNGQGGQTSAFGNPSNDGSEAHRPECSPGGTPGWLDALLPGDSHLSHSLPHFAIDGSRAAPHLRGDSLPVACDTLWGGEERRSTLFSAAVFKGDALDVLIRLIELDRLRDLLLRRASRVGSSSSRRTPMDSSRTSAEPRSASSR